jgi:hypothetical protein
LNIRLSINIYLPKAITNLSIKRGKSYIRLHNQSGVILKEYSVTESENKIKCLVGVLTIDTLTVEYQILSSEKAIVDLVVDSITCGRGIARKGAKTYRGRFYKTLCCDWSSERRTKKGKLQICNIVV